MIDVDRAHFVTLLKARCGIELTPQKAYLIDSRLQGVAERAGRAGVPALLADIREEPGSALADAALDAMTINETLFFRDGWPYQRLAEMLRRAGRVSPAAPFRVWSAACSTGQEPYSIAMTALETPNAPPVAIVATDLSPRCVEVAREGRYSDFDLRRGVSDERREKHFEPAGDGVWAARPRLRQMITWTRHNLLEPLRMPHRFDAVLCRNVLIYFDLPTRRTVLEHIAQRMSPGGSLMLGGAESAAGITPAFRPAPDAPGVYERC